MRKLIMLSFTILLVACSASNPSKKDTQNNSTPQSKEQQDLADSLKLLFGERVKPDMAEVEKYPLGSKDNPIRVSGPSGERKYLSELICNNGEPVSAYSRVGSAGTGPYGAILDVYIVICDTDKGVVEHSVFMDMYHGEYVEKRPAHGFKTLESKSK
jgi:hypothetical protein